ncbi:Hypothetical protein A7982_05764 [Minicystis rosea]|nr:Hypothetical protein A7982_05764 [Minicystis rosea]
MQRSQRRVYAAVRSRGARSSLRGVRHAAPAPASNRGIDHDDCRAP